MSPSLCDGDFIISFKWQLPRLKAGDIVVVTHPFYGVIVKRIKRIYSATSSYDLIGDNPASTSTEKMGIIERNNIIGRVVFHIRRPHLSIDNISKP